MREFVTPRIVSSKCIEFEACRYNGLIISSNVIKNLKRYAEFIPICPEVELGLGVPRDPVRLVDLNGKEELIQPATGKILTQDMENFSQKFLESLPPIDGFILKNRSPSCGIKNIRVYNGIKDSRPRNDGVGLFAAAVQSKYPYLAIEDEGRLNNFRIRENFLTKLFLLSEFRKIRQSGDFNDLLKFHTHNKLLLLSYSQIYLQRMGRLISNRKSKPLSHLKSEYQNLLWKALLNPPKITTNINVLHHALGYFSKLLKAREKSFFLDSIEKYRAGRIPLLVTLNLLQSWIIRFNVEYLADQTFFEPYPPELMQITFIFEKLDL